MEVKVHFLIVTLISLILSTLSAMAEDTFSLYSDKGEVSIVIAEVKIGSQEDEIKIVEGFFKGIRGDKILIDEKKTYERYSFPLSPKVKIGYQDEDAEIEDIFIDSIIRVKIINNIVTEIEIVEVSS